MSLLKKLPSDTIREMSKFLTLHELHELVYSSLHDPKTKFLFDDLEPVLQKRESEEYAKTLQRSKDIQDEYFNKDLVHIGYIESLQDLSGNKCTYSVDLLLNENAEENSFAYKNRPYVIFRRDKEHEKYKLYHYSQIFEIPAWRILKEFILFQKSVDLIMNNSPCEIIPKEQMNPIYKRLVNYMNNHFPPNLLLDQIADNEKFIQEMEQLSKEREIRQTKQKKSSILDKFISFFYKPKV